MKRIIAYGATLLLALLACSCIKEQATEDGGQDGKDIKIQFKMGLPASEGSRTGGQSRSLNGDDTGDEILIDAVDILAFVKAGDGQYRYSYSATNISRSGTETEMEVVATVKKYPAEQIFLIFCNASGEIAAADTRPNEEIGAALTRIKCGGAAAGEWPAKINGATAFKPFPMYARTSAQVISDTNKEIGDFPLVRMVARADITLKSGLSDFILVSAQVFNRATYGYVPYDFSGWNAVSKRVTSAGVPAESNPGDPILPPSVVYDAAYGGDARGEILRSIYLFESAGVSEADRLKGTAIIVGGKYGGSNDVTYYRIDIKTDATQAGYVSQDILRNHWYRIEIQSVAGPGFDNPEDAYIGKKPIEFTVSVTNWGASHSVPLISLYEPEYFIIDHTYNTTEIHLHMVKYNQPNGHLWYTYANVPDGHDSEDAPPAGAQVSPPRKHSCASLYSKDSSCPWRLPTYDEILTIRDYALNNGGVALYNFDLTNNAMYWSASTPAGAPDQAYVVQIYTTGYGNQPKGSLIWGSGGYARCVRNNTGSETPPPAATLTTDADGAYFPAIAEPQTITVTSNTRWIASIKRGTNVVTTGEASVLGQPLVNTTTGFNGGSADGYIADGTANTNTVKTFTITPVDYINDPWKEAMGDLTIIFRDSETGKILKETTVTITSGEIQPPSNSYIVKTSGVPILIPVGRANESTLGIQIGTDEAITAHFIWSDNVNCLSANGPVKNLKPAGKGSTAYILVIPGASKGNSVVAVATPAKSTEIGAPKVGGGNAALNDPVIRWSWHIWTVDPNNMPGESGTSGWMDRNLGALATTWSAYVIGDVVVGNYYQWGRKDPLPRGTAGYVNGVLTTMPTNGTAGLTNSVRMPYSWLSSWSNGSAGTSSWNNGTANYKTVYDPCPKGWRMPLTGVWGTGGTSGGGAIGSWGAWLNNGRVFLTSGDFWPSTGQRTASGTFYAIPSGAGYYWSGTAYDSSQSYDLDIGPSYVGVNYRASNGSGMNVRCIKDPYYTDN